MNDMKQDEIKRPAVKIQQGNKTLLATSFRVEDFQNPGFYRIDRLDPENRAGGYQRILQKSRAKSLANYVVEAWEANRRAFLPTSVFLATEKDIAFDEERNEINFRSTEVCPFDVVDGQHRIEGLLLAAEKIPELARFPIAANIAVNASYAEQVLHFYIVNTTQRAVDEGVAQQIRARFYEMLDTENLPYIPSWMEKRISTGTDQEALSVVTFLNSEDDSPWCNRVQMANQEHSASHSVTQKTFVNVLKKTILRDGHPLKFEDDNRRNRIFKKYWIAIERIFTETSTRNKTVVFKSTGSLFFCRVSSTVISIANSTNRLYRVEDFERIFQSVRDYLSPEISPIISPDWWISGGPASGMNSGAIEKKAVEFSRAMNEATRQRISEN